MKTFRLPAALFVIALQALGCGDDDDGGTTTVTDTGVVDTGGGADTSVADTGGGGTDTGGGGTDTGMVDTGPPKADAATKHTINVGPTNMFAPSNLTIKVGDTIEWVWKESGHTVTEGTSCTAKSGGFDSGLQNTGFTFSRTFSTAGTVDYFCIPHCSLGMTGKITVAP
ncbi:MAG: hypothetical protein HYV09_27370 [Deltaproteobacteria bacterium]|nr:hypothetical protein [Deltaproteobacteria bacterium]